MHAYNCKICGMPMDILEGMHVCTCEHCGSSQTLPKLGNEERIAAINRANQLRRNGNFDRALQMFEEKASDTVTAEAVSMVSQEAVQTQTERDSREVRNTRFALQEVDDEWNWLEKEDAYHYLVSLGDYEDANLILDEYRYEQLPKKMNDDRFWYSGRTVSI